VITVDGGIDIAGVGDLALTLAATKVIFNENSYLDVKDAAGKFGEADQTETKITVAGTGLNVNAAVTNDGTTWTVTAAETGTNITSAPIILGTLALGFNGESPVSTAPGAEADADPAKAPGKLIAGAGTTITFIGTGE
jgi:hypothetical protein